MLKLIIMETFRRYSLGHVCLVLTFGGTFREHIRGKVLANIHTALKHVMFTFSFIYFLQQILKHLDFHDATHRFSFIISRGLHKTWAFGRGKEEVRNHRKALLLGLSTCLGPSLCY